MQDLRYKAHSRAVALWIENALLPDDELNSYVLIEEFESLLNSLMDTVRTSVGETTVTAVADRVLYNSSERYPVLAKIQLRDHGFDFTKMRDDSSLKTPEEIKNAFHYFITELLFMIGKLSGGSLTLELHAVLEARVSSQNVGKKFHLRFVEKRPRGL